MSTTTHAVLDSLNHRNLRVQTRRSAALGDAVMACMVMPAEFRRAQAHYPIVFRRDLESGRLMALALFGFENGENLFLAPHGWDAAWIPLAHAVQPFLIGRSADPAATPQVHIDMASPRVVASGEEGERLFNDMGQPAALLEQVAQQLGDLDAAYKASGAFFEAMERHGLIEPFTLEVPLPDGSSNSLVGFQTVNEDRLRELPGDVLGELNAQGHLMPLFMAVASIGRFSDLVARRNARDGG
ncbi:MAG: SapC family protein [Novosphingobium meiothermophilum]|uniref:SapC family protein n=1 Tax=Novosphingobium TaxID=165696 RepID=UPI000D6E714D|nr:MULTISPECIES: SapC family protein [Novosphingobium]